MKTEKWFDKECFDFRKQTKSKLRRYCKTHEHADKQSYVEARREYDFLLRLKTHFQKGKDAISY